MFNWIQINVSDRCTLRCKDCHWFAQKVKVVETVTKDDVLFFINRWQPTIVQFSGGEPTLWPELVSTINEIPMSVKIILNSNGTRPKVIEEIKRQIKLSLSIHQQTDLELFAQTKKIATEKRFKVDFATFDLPDSSVEILRQQNQMDIKGEVNKKVLCKPTKIYFGSDGKAYQCEKGLRTKDPAYFAGFTLRDGEPHQNARECITDHLCITTLDEQEIKCVE